MSRKPRDPFERFRSLNSSKRYPGGRNWPVFLDHGYRARANGTLSISPVSSQNQHRRCDKNLSHWLGRLNITNDLSRVALRHLFNLALCAVLLPRSREAVTFVLVCASDQPDELRKMMEDSSCVRTLLKWCQVVGSFFDCFLYSKI